MSSPYDFSSKNVCNMCNRVKNFESKRALVQYSSAKQPNFFTYLTVKQGKKIFVYVDDAEKSTVSYMALTCSKQRLHNTKREDLAESTGVVPAKYPPKVKLELLITLKC